MNDFLLGLALGIFGGYGVGVLHGAADVLSALGVAL